MITIQTARRASQPAPVVRAQPSIIDRMAREMLNLRANGITVTRQALLNCDMGFTGAEIDSHGEAAADRAVEMRRTDEARRRVA